jgi:hypothetical protein
MKLMRASMSWRFQASLKAASVSVVTPGDDEEGEEGEEEEEEREEEGDAVTRWLRRWMGQA